MASLRFTLGLRDREEVSTLEKMLTKKQRDPIAPLPPPQKPLDRPRADDRQALEGILWVLKTGSRWQDLPREYESKSRCHRRLKEWQEQGVWVGRGREGRPYPERERERGTLGQGLGGSLTSLVARSGGWWSARLPGWGASEGWWWGYRLQAPPLEGNFGMSSRVPMRR